MKAIAISSILLAGAISAPAHAAPTCLIEIDGKRLFDGSCDALRLDNGGVFMGDRKSVSALIRPRLGNGDDAVGAYKADGLVHDLEYLRRDGVSCWRGSG